MGIIHQVFEDLPLDMSSDKDPQLDQMPSMLKTSCGRHEDNPTTGWAIGKNYRRPKHENMSYLEEQKRYQRQPKTGGPWHGQISMGMHAHAPTHVPFMFSSFFITFFFSLFYFMLFLKWIMPSLV